MAREPRCRGTDRSHLLPASWWEQGLSYGQADNPQKQNLLSATLNLPRLRPAVSHADFPACWKRRRSSSHAPLNQELSVFLCENTRVCFRLSGHVTAIRTSGNMLPWAAHHRIRHKRKHTTINTACSVCCCSQEARQPKALASKSAWLHVRTAAVAGGST